MAPERARAWRLRAERPGFLHKLPRWLNRLHEVFTPANRHFWSKMRIGNNKLTKSERP